MIAYDLCLHRGMEYRRSEYLGRNALQQVRSERMQTPC